MSGTTNFNFQTIQPSQLNWDEDINLNWNDLDFLLDAMSYPVRSELNLLTADERNLGQFPLVRVSDKIHALPIFEETDNIVPETLGFAPPTWTYSGSVVAYLFDAYMQSKKVVFYDSSSYIQANFTTTDATTYTVSYLGDATVEIYDGGTLIATITSSPTTINLTANHTYTVKVSGNGKWIAHLQIEPKDYATYFSTKEWKRYSQNIKWVFEEEKKKSINVLFSLYTGKSSEWGRLLWTNSFEVFLNANQDTIYLSDGGTTVQSAISLVKGKIYLLSAITTDSKIKVYLNKSPILELSSDKKVKEIGFKNGCFNGFVFGISAIDYVEREDISTPVLNLFSNRTIPDGIFYFADGDTTPSVKNGKIFKTQNSSSTTITNFDDGIIGQEITIIFTDSNTTIKHGSGIYLRSGSDETPAANTTKTFVYDGANWFEK